MGDGGFIELNSSQNIWVSLEYIFGGLVQPSNVVDLIWPNYQYNPKEEPTGVNDHIVSK